MNNKETFKAAQLRKHKATATLLFVFMMLSYIALETLMHKYNRAWMAYAKAFAEAAMVGALADWFAVAALFHHPLGLKIPHTNLIEKKKKDIGDNLGKFVAENFLNPQTIRPYLNKIKVSDYIIRQLEKEKNRQLLISETAKIIIGILQKTNDDTAAKFIAKKSEELIDKTPLNRLAASVLQYFVDNGEQEKLLTYFLNKAKYYVAENEDKVKQRVKKESGILVPGFVNNIIANRITVGIADYLHEIEGDVNHPIRQELTQQIRKIIHQLREENKWKNEFDKWKLRLLSQQHLHKYASDIWMNIKAVLINELSNPNTAFINYIGKNLIDFSENLKTDEALKNKINSWVKLNAYRIFLRNVNNIRDVIGNAIGNWKSNELSRKLELEVGKDLQYIRVNGTLVGGLVGLLIYAITRLLIH